MYYKNVIIFAIVFIKYKIKRPLARTVDYSKKAEKIKEQVDELVQELMAAKSAPVVSKRSLKVADINFENEDVNTLMQIQARLARVILEKSK